MSRHERRIPAHGVDLLDYPQDTILVLRPRQRLVEYVKGGRREIRFTREVQLSVSRSLSGANGFAGVTSDMRFRRLRVLYFPQTHKSLFTSPFTRENYIPQFSPPESQVRLAGDKKG